MTPKAISHVIQGMQKDTSKSKLSKEFAFDAKNIRITAREDNSLLTITNEKGTTSSGSFPGIYIGHCVIQEALVVFSKYTTPGDQYAPDCILLFYPKKSPFYDLLYRGNLNFSADNTIETLGVYENEEIQKVYWVDGINQPRVINIKTKEDNRKKWKDNSFDFLPELKLEESIKIESQDGSSVFAPGVIQYAFTYYNKYGQESNIFNTSPLCYLTHKSRGASPEEIITDKIFNIRIDNVDTSFDNIRIYSIHRTSLNSIPTVKRVIDLPITINEYKYSSTKIPSYDFKNRLFTARAYCIDGVGKRTSLDSIIKKSRYVTKQENNKEIITYTIDLSNYKSIEYSTNDRVDTLSLTKSYVNTFTCEFVNTFYIEGTLRTEVEAKLVFTKSTQTNVTLNRKEKNTDPAYISYTDNGTLGDTIDPTQLLYIGGEDIISSTITSKDNTLFLGNIELKRKLIPDSIKEKIKNINISTDYRSINTPVYTQENNIKYPAEEMANDISYFKPGEHYRFGVQFQYKNGKWSNPIFIRDYTVNINYYPYYDDYGNFHIPYLYINIPETIITDLKDLGFKKSRSVVVIPEEHERKIIAQGLICPTVYNNDNRDSNAPYAQSSWFLRPNLNSTYLKEYEPDDDGAVVQFLHSQPTLRIGRGSEIQNSQFYIDQSFLTLHSPDIEFTENDSIYENTNIKMRIVGFANFTANYGDVDIKTDTATRSEFGLGFIHKPMSVTGGKGMVADLIFHDSSSYDSVANRYYLVYPWHRSGSLNDDNASTASGSDRAQYAVLKKKRLSNIKYASHNTWLRPTERWDTFPNDTYKNSFANGISKIGKFNSDQVSLLKITDASGNHYNYYGNIDTLISSADSYDIYASYSREEAEIEDVGNGSEPVRMTYKSTPHVVFKLNKSLEGHSVILPNIENINSQNDTEEFKVESVTQTEDYGERIEHFVMYDPSNSYPAAADVGDLCLVKILNLFVPTDPPYMIYEGYYIVKKNSDGYWYIYSGDLAYIETQPNVLDLYKCLGETYHGTDIIAWKHYKTINVKTDDSTTIKIKQDTIKCGKPDYPYLYIGELYKDSTDIVNAFGGTSEDALINNSWIPAGNSTSIDNQKIEYTNGDTRYQRYDCLKTYAFTPEDENQVIEIASFMCETRVNLLGRYDKNIGNTSNLNADPTNFNLLNTVYSQRDNFFNYRILDSDVYKLDKFTNTITWSKEKFAGEDVDTWTNITMANTLDLDGTKGKINKLITTSNNILAFQDKGIADILFNSRVQIPVSDGVPVEISNGYKVDGFRYISDTVGCKNKHSIQITPSGVYFLDSESNGIYLLADGLKNISTEKGFDIWTKEVANDPTFKTFYDKNNKDVYFNTDTYSLCYSEKIGNFISFYDYNGVDAMFNIENGFYSIKNKDNYCTIYRMFDGPYNTFFEESKPYSITLISNDDPQVDKVFTNLDYRADFFDSNNNYLENESFDTLEVWNEYQSGKETLKYSKFRPSNLKKKFRIWGANIPRDKKNKLDRMRNPWLFIKLSKENPGTSKMELHDIVVKYFE